MEKLSSKPEQKLKAMAAEVAKSISIRSYYTLNANGEKIPIDGGKRNARKLSR